MINLSNLPGISRSRLLETIGRENQSARSNGKGSSYKVYGVEAQRKKRASIVDSLALNTTAVQFPNCSCHEHGLVEGITVHELMREVRGCQDRFICPRLDKVRRLHGV